MGDKYDKSLTIVFTNDDGNQVLNKSVIRVSFNKPIIIPPMSRYYLRQVVGDGGMNAGVNAIFNIQEFPNKCFVGNINGGRMINGLVYIGELRAQASLINNNGVAICNKEPLTFGSMTLRLSDFDGQPLFPTDNGLEGGNEISFALELYIEQDKDYEMMNVNKRNQELLAGLMAAKKEFNPVNVENI